MANYSLRESLKQLGKKILGSCVNSCVSTASNLPLAASQGKVLQDQINTLNSNIICTNISMESSSDDAEFYFSNGIEGLYLVVAIDLDDKSNIDNRGFIAIMDVRKNTSYRHILQSNTIGMSGHSHAIVLLRGATNYLCSSIRLVRY